MKLLIDENVAREVVDSLTERGHDVVWIARSSPGLSDDEIFRFAVREQRVVLTHDKGHGRRALTQRVPGVILIRLTVTPAMLEASVLIDVLESRGDWAGSLAVISGRRVRIRPLPWISR